MKNILFPTDFSQCSLNALDFALGVVNQLRGQLTIVHAYHLPYLSTDALAVSFKKEVEARIKILIKRIQPDLAKDVTVNFLVRQAAVIPFLSCLSKSFDLVVMSTKGASGLKEVFVGTITNGLIKNTQTPVLVIPKGYAYKPFKNIVLSLDDRPISEAKVVETIKDLANNFNAELTLFHTEETPVDKGINEHVLTYFGRIGYSIDYNFIYKSINESIAEMAVDYEVDLVGLIRRERGLLSALFHSSVTSKEVFHSRIPLLILHDIL